MIGKHRNENIGMIALGLSALLTHGEVRNTLLGGAMVLLLDLLRRGHERDDE